MTSVLLAVRPSCLTCKWVLKSLWWKKFECRTQRLPLTDWFSPARPGESEGRAAALPRWRASETPLESLKEGAADSGQQPKCPWGFPLPKMAEKKGRQWGRSYIWGQVRWLQMPSLVGSYNLLGVSWTNTVLGYMVIPIIFIVSNLNEGFWIRESRPTQI